MYSFTIVPSTNDLDTMIFANSLYKYNPKKYENVRFKKDNKYI